MLAYCQVMNVTSRMW